MAFIQQEFDLLIQSVEPCQHIVLAGINLFDQGFGFRRGWHRGSGHEVELCLAAAILSGCIGCFAEQACIVAATTGYAG
jgi:hypothetical protein